MDSCLEYLFLKNLFIFFTPDIKYTFCVVADWPFLKFRHCTLIGGGDLTQIRLKVKCFEKVQVYLQV